jgi:hypothetical protein
MKKLVVLLGLAMFMATSAFAVVDPDTDMMGIYWDANADMPCTAAVTYPVNMYIILTNPSVETIGGFECAFTIEGAMQPYLLGAVLPANALDVAAGFQNFIVGLGTPLNTTEATVLATISVLNAAGMDLDFYLHQASPPSIDGVLPVIVSDSVLMTLGTSSLPGSVTAHMGSNCTVVATEDASWDSVKSLYR